MRGAGGSDGGLMSFLIGLVMMGSGFYMLLNAIVIRSRFNFGYHIYSSGGFNVTSGMIMIPFIFGVGLIFYNSKKLLRLDSCGGLTDIANFWCYRKCELQLSTYVRI